MKGHLSRQTPTTFLLQNEDDDVDGVEQALAYYAGLKQAGAQVEMHLYAQGGHAFGLRRTNLPVDRMAWVGGEVAGHDWGTENSIAAFLDLTPDECPLRAMESVQQPDQDLLRHHTGWASILNRSPFAASNLSESGR